MIQKSPLEMTLHHLRLLHQNHAELAAFCPFPDDVKRQELIPYHIPAADIFQNQVGLQPSNYPELRDALIALSPDMLWRETYKDTNIAADFMERFGCYEIIGRDAPYASAKMRSFLVFQPPHLHYPWHHHPADEIYVVVAGEAEFHLDGRPSETLTTGQAAFHPSNAPHALTSHDHPVLAYVVWRDEFETGPVWSESEKN
ncbi:dimethylsulfonioproprionate lyase family protein [Planktotalea sp.]|uniref:dimethylsulfonioproprionate lyase family protein n=1 Tax=Planktotalea sp. TaxID=2029877 RepID=UPI003D6A3291